jgi:hypothetical protein
MIPGSKRGAIMEPMKIIDRIHEAINGLPVEKLRIALDILEDLKRSDDEETDLLLKDHGFIEEYRKAKKDIRTGNTINWTDIKRNV